MKIRSRQLSLNNVVGFEMTFTSAIDLFTQMEQAGQSFKELLIQNGYYTNGPVIAEYNPFASHNEITVMTTIGNKVNLVGTNTSKFFYKENVAFTTDYFYRHYDQEEVIPYEEIRNKVVSEKGILRTIYHVLLDLSGDLVIDLYCEVDRQ